MANVTSMDTKIFCRDNDSETKYEVSFETHNRAFYEKVVAVCRECIDKTVTSEVPEYVDTKINNTDDKTFDIVDAFMHLIWGRKVRMTTWAKDEYIMLVNDIENTDIMFLVDAHDKFYPAENLFRKCLTEGKWEDYKEES